MPSSFKYFASSIKKCANCARSFGVNCVKNKSSEVFKIIAASAASPSQASFIAVAANPANKTGIISKEELTTDYLMEKLGIKEKSKFRNIGYSLARDIINATTSGVRWHDVEQIDYETILKIFGEESAKKYKKLLK